MLFFLYFFGVAGLLLAYQQVHQLNRLGPAVTLRVRVAHALIFAAAIGATLFAIDRRELDSAGSIIFAMALRGALRHAQPPAIDTRSQA